MLRFVRFSTAVRSPQASFDIRFRAVCQARAPKLDIQPAVSRLVRRLPIQVSPSRHVWPALAKNVVAVAEIFLRQIVP